VCCLTTRPSTHIQELALHWTELSSASNWQFFCSFVPCIFGGALACVFYPSPPVVCLVFQVTHADFKKAKDKVMFKKKEGVPEGLYM